jgi:GDP-4-dehydro-6-deoxy-D-mannose reductase
VGTLSPVREFLHVSDVVAAYVALLDRGEPGEVYNVASGQPVSLRAVFETLAELVGHEVVPDPDPELLRPADIPHLVGDSAKLRARTGWKPHVSLRDALAEVVNAQTH